MSAPAGRRARGKDDEDDVPIQTTTRMKAPSAAAVAPPSLHTDPQPAAAAPPTAGTAAAAPITSVRAATKSSSVNEVFTADYDTMTYTALQKLLAAFTRAQVENARGTREQATSTGVATQQGLRIEKFLDVASFSALVSDSQSGGFDENNYEGYTYNAMLTRLFEALNRNNEGTSVGERNQVPVPILEKIGKKKTVISNFGRICTSFNRPLEDVKDFIEKELSIRGNLDSNNALILKFETRKATDFDRILIKYLDMYVKCNSCHTINTTLTKEGRRLELRCNWCTATRTVTAAEIATFSAMVEKRSKVRAAMTL